MKIISFFSGSKLTHSFQQPLKQPQTSCLKQPLQLDQTKIWTQKLDETGRAIEISTECDLKQTQNLLKIYFYAKMFGL